MWVRSEANYTHARATIDVLPDAIGDSEDHPLADMLDYLSDQVKAYEDEHFAIPEAEPREVLRFLMEPHRLKQEEFADCASRSRLSDILNGRRDISKDIAKTLAQRFNVYADLFL